MARPEKLEKAEVDRWIATHPGWERTSGDSIAKTYKFPDFSAAMGFVVRVGLAAEKHDHHPDAELGWGKARVVWSTHDAGGITRLDLELAETCDLIAS
jgi:4a-hydroxytetrahydrobiopterin dehydratase